MERGSDSCTLVSFTVHGIDFEGEEDPSPRTVIYQNVDLHVIPLILWARDSSLHVNIVVGK